MVDLDLSELGPELVRRAFGFVGDLNLDFRFSAILWLNRNYTTDSGFPQIEIFDGYDCEKYQEVSEEAGCRLGRRLPGSGFGQPVPVQIGIPATAGQWV